MEPTLPGGTAVTTTPTHHSPDRRRRRGLALLAAVALLLGACSSSSDDAGDEPTSDRAGEGSGSSDAEGGLVTTDDDATEDAMEDDEGSDDAMEDDEGDAEAMADDDAMQSDEGASDEGESEERASDDAGSDGFFGSVDGEDPDDEAAALGFRTFVDTSRDPLSTFALDVDTASYTIARNWVDDGALPPQETVRVEEFVNAFDYDYPAPSDGLALSADGGPSPFDPDRELLRIGVRAEEVAGDERPEAALTFVVDTSGSMDRSDRIGLVRDSLTTLVRELDVDDTVAIVTYDRNAEVLLEPTEVRDRDRILDAIDGLRTGGSTNLEAGLARGYALADDAFVDGGINRVVLASDGIANVGLTDPDGLVSMIRGDADRGIHLVTVGVGMGGFNDELMETLADDGDGFYAYVDERSEAERLFGDELVSTLLTAAIDAKIQVEFDEDTVEEYRLLGYENRAVLDRDFRNDDVDAGELGAGHEVTAIYELVLADDLDRRDRLGAVSLRWEDPDRGDVVETRLELTAGMLDDEWTDTTDDFRLAASVAVLAELLRGSPYADQVSFDEVQAEVRALRSSAVGSAEVDDLERVIDRLIEIS